MRNVTILLAVMAVIALAGSAFGANRYWGAETATWHDSTGNWLDAPAGSTANEPTALDAVYINNGGNAQITGTANALGTMLGEAGGDSGTITQTSGTFTEAGVTNSYIGKAGTGTYNQEGGTATWGSTWMYIGNGGTGTYNLSGAGSICNVNGGLLMGYNYGTAAFNQDGGTANIGKLRIGYSYGSATYTITAGKLDAGKQNNDGIVVGHQYSRDFHMNTLSMGGGTVEVTNLVVANTYYSSNPLAYSSRGKVEITNAAAVIEVKEKLHLKGIFAEFTAVEGSTIHMTDAIVSGNCPNWAFCHWAADFDIGADDGTTDYSPDPAKMAGLNNLTLIFEGGLVFDEDTATLEVAGDKSIGAAAGGTDYLGLFENYALNMLQVGGADNAEVYLVDNRDNGYANEALYVRNLIINTGSTLDLNGQTLYYLNGTFNGSVADTAGGGALIQIPEPATVVLLGIGGIGVLIRRKRR